MYIYNYIYIWVNYNNSLTWIKAILGWFPLLTMIFRVRSQWGRYNLPRYIVIGVMFTNLAFPLAREPTHFYDSAVPGRPANLRPRRRRPRRKRQLCQSSMGIAANINVAKSSGMFRGSLRHLKATWWIDVENNFSTVVYMMLIHVNK